MIQLWPLPPRLRSSVSFSAIKSISLKFCKWRTLPVGFEVLSFLHLLSSNRLTVLLTDCFDHGHKRGAILKFWVQCTVHCTLSLHCTVQYTPPNAMGRTSHHNICAKMQWTCIKKHESSLDVVSPSNIALVCLPIWTVIRKSAGSLRQIIT